MRKYKLTLSMIIVIVLLVVTFGACGKETPPLPPEPTMETDLSYDSTSDVGLYWYGDDSKDFIRSSQNVDIKYFDPSLPTVLYFHGWAIDAEEGQLVEKFWTTATSVSKCGVDSVDYVVELKELGYNVGAMSFLQYSKDLNALFGQIWVDFGDGHSIACLFAKELAAFASDYHQRLVFMGHSYGTQSATATAYMLGKMYDDGVITNSDLIPDRISLADPYIGDIGVMSNMEILNSSIENVGESIGGRLPAELMADCFAYLNGKGAAIDVYCGMPFAYDSFATTNTTLRTSITAKIKANCVWTVLRGAQREYGSVGDIHVITRDWMLMSLFVVNSISGEYYPTAGLDDEKTRALMGKEYETLYEGLSPEDETYNTIS